MDVYLSSPGSQMHADHCRGMDVLVSYAAWSRWQDDYIPSYRTVLYDSGAYSVLNSGVKIDVIEYRDWLDAGRRATAVACAGLDDIAGDWRQSLRNYEAAPGTFPTFHDTDPPELLPDLIGLARSCGGWLGIGLKPPRTGKELFLRETFDRIPEDIHVHGWALREYTYLPYTQFRSVDSRNWCLDSWQILGDAKTRHLTPAEATEIVVKRYQRWRRQIERPDRNKSESLYAS